MPPSLLKPTAGEWLRYSMTIGEDSPSIITKWIFYIEVSPNEIVIRSKSKLDTMESEPHFATFIKAIALDAMKHPEKLHDLQEVWRDLDSLLKDVPYEGDDE